WNGDAIKIDLMRRHHLQFLSVVSLLVIRQWGTATLANVVGVVVALPIAASTVFRSVVSDSGEGACSLGGELTGGKSITVWQNMTYNYAVSPGNCV
ncbi:hypothetical protein, partial [Megasphaera stantonii]|uniref:hypothetical protein n=1 Tax=Megasphaera stantonii TaxID=2144175 RepID=UPI001E53B578